MKLNFDDNKLATICDANAKFSHTKRMFNLLESSKIID